MNNIAICGGVIVFLGILGFAVPVLAPLSSENNTGVGGMRYQAIENISYSISPYRSGGVLFLGLIIIGGGLFRFD